MTFTPTRMLHLFVAVALLFSQWATAQHMMSHLDDSGVTVHGMHAFATGSVEQIPLASGLAHQGAAAAAGLSDAHGDGKAHRHNSAFAASAAMDEQEQSHDTSCAIYHAFSSSCLIADFGVYSAARVAREQRSVMRPVQAVATADACCHLIRGPPVFS